MRFLALTLYVCLSVSASGAEASRSWTIVHQDGLDAADRGNFEQAATVLRQSAQLAENNVQRALSANDLGVVLYRLNRNEEARPQLERAFSLWQEIPGGQNHLAQTTETLAAVYSTLGAYPEAEVKLREALRTPPAETEEKSFLMNELGDILREVGRMQEAADFFEQSLSLKGVSDRRKLDAYIGLADLDRENGRWDSAVQRWHYAESLAHQNGWRLMEATTVRGLASTYLEHAEFQRAEPLLRKALSEFEAISAPQHEIASTLSCLAQLYISENKLGMAEEILTKAIDITEKTLSPTHPQVAILWEMMGASVAMRNQMDEARDYYLRARSIMAGKFGENSPIAAAVDASWAQTEHRAKRNREAAADYEKALLVLDAAGSEAEPLRSTTQAHYAQVCKELHRKMLPEIASRVTSASLR